MAQATFGGNAWPMDKKPVNPTYQPCTSTWKLEPIYNDPTVLVDNWYETREQYKHDTKEKREMRCESQLSKVPLDTSIYSTSYQNPQNLKSASSLAEFHQQQSARVPTKPDCPESPYQTFMKYLNDVNSCPQSLITNDMCKYSRDHCNPCSALPKLTVSSVSQNKLPPIEQRQLPPLNTVHIDKNGACDPQTPGSATTQLTRVTKWPIVTSQPYRIPPGRGVYPLMEQALTETRHINKYTDRYCTTPTYAMRCLCNECDLDEVTQVNQMNKWKTSFIETDPCAIPNLYKDSYPVSYNRRINWVVPNYKTSCHLTCQ